MDGYLGENEGYQPVDKPAQRDWWKTVLFAIAYFIPLLWLFNLTDYPDSLGVHITAHGKSGVLEEWYYSYLLIERHRVLDVITFLYMWAIVIAVAIWMARAIQKDRRGKQAASPRLSTPSIFDAEEAADRRQRLLIALAVSIAIGVGLIAILYSKGAV